MALISKVGVPSNSSVLPPQTNTLVGGIAGEAIEAGDVCYINSNGTIMRSNGTSANAAAKADGIALISAPSGEAITLGRDINIRYGAGLTPGARLFVGATAGRLDDAATTGGTAPVAFVLWDGARIRFHGSYY